MSDKQGTTLKKHIRRQLHMALLTGLVGALAAAGLAWHSALPRQHALVFTAVAAAVGVVWGVCTPCRSIAEPDESA